MKFIVTVISSLIAGLVLATSDISPIQELQRILSNKRRILYGLIFGSTSFVLVMASVLIAVIEAALQYDVHGFVFWSALFSVSVGLSCVAVFFLVACKMTWPKIAPPVKLAFAGFDQLNLAHIVESWLNQLAQDKAEPQSPPMAAAEPFHENVTPQPQFSH